MINATAARCPEGTGSRPDTNLNQSSSKHFQGSVTALSIIFGLMAAIFAGLLIWREFSTLRPDRSSLLERFPGYFRSRLEQEYYQSFVLKYRDYLAANRSRNFNKTCEFVCQRSTATTRRRRATYHRGIYHSCCYSETSFLAPDRWRNKNNVSLKLAQLSRHKQYFETETCEFLKGCTGCRCIQDIKVITAVVEGDGTTTGDDQYFIDFFPLPGCCRCRNSV